MAGREQYTAAQVVDAIPGTGGLPVAIGQKLRPPCTGQTVRNYAARYPTVAAAMKAERENTGDFVENALILAIKEGNIAAIIFYLKTQCKDRGYVERQEVTGKDGGPMTLAIVENIISADAHRND